LLLPWLAWDGDLSTYTSHTSYISGITGVNHHAWLVCLDGGGGSH
jgi:hypothetical protein